MSTKPARMTTYDRAGITRRSILVIFRALLLPINVEVSGSGTCTAVMARISFLLFYYPQGRAERAGGGREGTRDGALSG